MKKAINPYWPVYFGSALVLSIVGLMLMITNNIVWVPLRDQMELDTGVLVVFCLVCLAAGLLGVCMTTSTEWWLRWIVPPMMAVIAAFAVGSIEGDYLGVFLAEGCIGQPNMQVVQCSGFEGLYGLKFREVAGPNLLKFEFISNR